MITVGLAEVTGQCQNRLITASIFSYFYSIIERADILARELGTSTKPKTLTGQGVGTANPIPHYRVIRASFARFFFHVRKQTGCQQSSVRTSGVLLPFFELQTFWSPFWELIQKAPCINLVPRVSHVTAARETLGTRLTSYRSLPME